jgi:hypothetical protein
MNAETRRQLSMARRALDYANANPIDNDGFKIALQRLDSAVTQATSLGLQETGGKTGQDSAVLQRRAARRKIREELLVRLVAIGQQAAENNPQLVGVFKLPGVVAPTKRFLLDARNLLAQATAHADILVPLGLGQSFLTDLGQALDQFEASGTAIDSGKGQHVGARKTYGRTIAQCHRAITVLDTFYQANDSADSPALAGWVNARTIEGPFVRSHDASVSPEPSPTPEPVAPSPEPAPAPSPEPAAIPVNPTGKAA